MIRFELLLFFLASSLISIALTSPDVSDHYWEQYKLKFSKSYRLKNVESFRKRIFEYHVSKILKHNLEADLGLQTFTMGINQYTDLTHEEFKTLLGIKPVGAPTAPKLLKMSPVFGGNDTVKVPDSIDWRVKGLVTPVRDQGKCGSCYSFAAVAVLEAQNARATGKLTPLSEQNLVDCSKRHGNEGCNGGLMDLAFEYVMENGGIATQDSYSYEGTDTGSCRYENATRGGSCAGFVDVKEGDEQALKQAVGSVGPVAVGIDAGSPFFQFYQNGVYRDPFCSPESINHGVTVVGYGSEKKGGDYWLIKNSWSEEWGDKGYIKLARNRNNMCGIASMASYPLV